MGAQHYVDANKDVKLIDFNRDGRYLSIFLRTNKKM